MKIKFNFNIFKIILTTILFIIGVCINNPTIKIILFVLSYLIISYEIFINAIKDIVHGEVFNENILMIIATIGAFCIKQFSEAVLVILLYEVGEYLSDLAVDNSKNKISKMMDLRSDYTNLKLENEIKKVNSSEVKIGDTFVVKVGEKVPIDGIVILGETYLDTSSLTGEAMPRYITSGDNILSGTLNLSAVIEVKATKVYKDSTASKIIDLLENSENHKSKTEKFITKFCKIYTPIVVLLAIIVAVLPPIIMGQSFTTWLYRAFEFLVISCPCALVLSVPLGYFCGIGKASKYGILVKGSNTLYNLSSIKTIICDKTGTLTDGKFNVQKIVANNINNEELLKVTAYAEYYSNHPIAKIILNKYDKTIDIKKIKDYQEISGKGVKCIVDGDNVIVGNYALLKENNVDTKQITNKIGTILYVAKNGDFIGYLVIADKIKSEAYSFVNSLYSLGINNIYVLSGDNEDIVKNVSNELNINKYYSNLLPHQKLEKLNELKDGKTVFVGDGLNDAAVIKTADVGVSMGTLGSDASIESSDVVIMNDNLLNVFKAIKIAKLTDKIIKQNIAFALSFKFIILILAFLGISPIWLAVFADVGVTLITVLYTLLILRKKV